MKEFWKKTQRIQSLKQNLTSKYNVIVNEDVLDKVLDSTKRRLEELNN